jgi:hypothetical protein
MYGIQTREYAPPDLEVAVRNRYFYGKLLDVFHFELETDYMNGKRALLNRLVTGWGVVCGLDVLAVDDGDAVYITRGVALDQWGREIIVPRDTRPIPLPDPGWATATSEIGSKYQGQERQSDYAEHHPRKNGGYGRQQDNHGHDHDHDHNHGEHDEDQDEDEEFYHLVICYNECETNPIPVLAGDCGDQALCSPGTIEERYRLDIRPGYLDPVNVWDCRIPDAITQGELQYDVLVRWITDNCPDLPVDPCVPLANILVRRGGDDGPYCEADDIDINIRQLALSNRALFYLIMSMLYEAVPARRRR